MGNYEANREEIKLRPRDAASIASARFRIAVANQLDGRGEHRRAFRVRTCRPWKDGGYTCKDGILCDHCRNVLTIKTKRGYGARVLAAMKDDEPRVLLYVTLTMGESVNLDAKCKDLHALLGQMPNLSDVWSKVEGMFWFLHEERGESRRTWRPHCHCVLVVKAADFIGFKNHFRRLVLAWTRAAWAVLHPTRPISEREKSGSPFRTLLRQQKIEPLHSFQRSSVRALKTAKHNRRAVVEDLSSLIEYGLKRKKQDESHPRGPRMRPRDYVTVALRTNNKRGVKGCLRGIAPKTLRESALELASLSSPIEAEQIEKRESATTTKRKKTRRTR